MLSFASAGLAMPGMLCLYQELWQYSGVTVLMPFHSCRYGPKRSFNTNVFLSFEQAGICRTPPDPVYSKCRLLKYSYWSCGRSKNPREMFKGWKKARFANVHKSRWIGPFTVLDKIIKRPVVGSSKGQCAITVRQWQCMKNTSWQGNVIVSWWDHNFGWKRLLNSCHKILLVTYNLI